MQISKIHYLKPRTLRVGELLAACKELAVQLDPPDARLKFTVIESTADGSLVIREVTQAEVELICEFSKSDLHCMVGDFYSENNFSLSAKKDGLIKLSLRVSKSEIAIDIPRILCGKLGLAQATPEDISAIEPQPLEAKVASLHERLEIVESQVLAPHRKLRCFLSYRFAPETEITALRLTQFLSLLGVEVITGSSYEPRQITKKVISRLREPLDFVVLLITSAGESMWTRDEIGTALHRGLALVPIVSTDATLSPGMFGDIEYVPFHQDHIGDSFLKLLEAVEFVRQQVKNTASNATSAG